MWDGKRACGSEVPRDRGAAEVQLGSRSNMLVRENRMELAQSCFNFLPTRIALDLAGWDEMDVFAHS